VDDLGAHALQDAPHDVDGGVMPVEQAGGGDETDLVGRAVLGQRLVMAVSLLGRILGPAIDVNVNQEKGRPNGAAWQR
jgi:hypothetical protein